HLEPDAGRQVRVRLELAERVGVDRVHGRVDVLHAPVDLLGGLDAVHGRAGVVVGTHLVRRAVPVVRARLHAGAVVAHAARGAGVRPVGIALAAGAPVGALAFDAGLAADAVAVGGAATRRGEAVRQR